MSDETIAPEVDIQGTEESVAKLNALGEAGQAAFDKIATAASQVGNASEGIQKMTEGGAAAFQQLSAAGAEAFSKILESATSGNFTGLVTHMFGELAGTITDVTQKAVEFVEAQASVAETMSNLAEATGMTVAEIGGLRDAFASVGISTNGFERSIGRLSITIGREWSQIQQSVRTSADAQTGAMLQVESATFAVQKAYTSMGMALSSASQTAAHDAMSIQEAALGLRKASSELADFAMTARSNSLSVESAQLALIRARMNLAKDEGHAPSEADEKALKLEQDKLAVKDAELKLDEAKSKKAKEGLEMEEKVLNVKKARMAVADAEQKQQEDAVKAQERIKDAAMGIDKAQLARSEASEKQHEQDLKNIPQIAREVEQVAEGHKKWSDVINHTEISAGNLTKALILASKAGGEEPVAMDVFKKMSELFAHMGNDADSMNKKLEIVQQTMGAGFRAGQASAAQLLAVLERGPAALDKFMKEAEAFSKIKFSGFNLEGAYESLKEFNSAASQFSAAFDQVKTRMAAVLSIPMTEYFTQLKNSLITDGSALNTFMKMLGDIVGRIAEIGKSAMGAIGAVIEAINAVINAISRLTGLKPETVMEALAAAAITANGGLLRIAETLVVLIARLALLGAGIGAVVQGVGYIYAAYLKLTGGAKDWNEALDNNILKLGKLLAQSSLGALGIKAENTVVGLNDKQMKDMGVKSSVDDQAAAANAKAADKERERSKQDPHVYIPPDKAKDDSGSKDAAAATKDAAAASKDAAAANKDAASAGKEAGTAGAAAATKTESAGSSLSGAASALGAVAAAFGTVIANIANGRSPSAVDGKAGGGKISGPGGPTDDSAGLFALSDGEYVVRSAAVSHYGEGLFAALNNLSVGGFATGGIVGSGARAPSVSGGSAHAAQSVLNLTIDGQQFNGLKAPEHVASKLKTFAVNRQSSSAGKSPSWLR